MPPRKTKAQIEAQINALEADIAKTENRQEYTSGGPGSGAHERRGDLRAKYDRLAKLEAEWKEVDAFERGGNVGYVQFERPR